MAIQKISSSNSIEKMGRFVSELDALFDEIGLVRFLYLLHEDKKTNALIDLCGRMIRIYKEPKIFDRRASLLINLIKQFGSVCCEASQEEMEYVGGIDNEYDLIKVYAFSTCDNYKKCSLLLDSDCLKRSLNYNGINWQEMRRPEEKEVVKVKLYCLVNSLRFELSIHSKEANTLPLSVVRKFNLLPKNELGKRKFFIFELLRWHVSLS